jgi:hypothetical protein
MIDRAAEFLIRHAEVCKRAARIEELQKFHTDKQNQLAAIEKEVEVNLDAIPGLYEGTDHTILKLA